MHLNYLKYILFSFKTVVATVKCPSKQQI